VAGLHSNRRYPRAFWNSCQLEPSEGHFCRAPESLRTLQWLPCSIRRQPIWSEERSIWSTLYSCGDDRQRSSDPQGRDFPTLRHSKSPANPTHLQAAECVWTKKPNRDAIVGYVGLVGLDGSGAMRYTREGGRISKVVWCTCGDRFWGIQKRLSAASFRSASGRRP
jgi:hypothetical protein